MRTATDTLGHIQEILEHFQVREGRPSRPKDADIAMRLIAEAVFVWSLSRFDPGYQVVPPGSALKSRCDKGGARCPGWTPSGPVRETSTPGRRCRSGP